MLTIEELAKSVPNPFTCQVSLFPSLLGVKNLGNPRIKTSNSAIPHKFLSFT